MKNFLSEHKILQAILCAAVLIISLVLVITGQKNVGVPGIVQMLIGLAGILGLLGYYNSFYNK